MTLNKPTSASGPAASPAATERASPAGLAAPSPLVNANKPTYHVRASSRRTPSTTETELGLLARMHFLFAMLYVTNLPLDTTEEEVKGFFDCSGKLEQASVVRSSKKCSAYVTLPEQLCEYWVNQTRYDGENNFLGRKLHISMLYTPTISADEYYGAFDDAPDSYDAVPDSWEDGVADSGY
jgi:hypothetical protein